MRGLVWVRLEMPGTYPRRERHPVKNRTECIDSLYSSPCRVTAWRCVLYSFLKDLQRHLTPATHSTNLLSKISFIHFHPAFFSNFASPSLHFLGTCPDKLSAPNPVSRSTLGRTQTKTMTRAGNLGGFQCYSLRRQNY